eukprot:Awhi_evm1s1892
MTVKFSWIWAKLNPAPDADHGVPCQRSSHGISLLNGGRTLLLHGGEKVARTPLDSSQATWAADEKDGFWSWRNISPPSPCPPPRVAHSQCVYNDNIIYIFGGRAGITMEEAAMNDLWKLDCSGEAGTEKWTLVIPDGDVPEPRSFHRMLSIGTNLY